MNKTELLEAALSYAARGWRVLPLYTPTPDGGCSCGKAGCDSVGKHPRWHDADLAHGLKDATTDPDKIRTWWQRWPDANIGIRTGPESGFFAVDVDSKAACDWLKTKGVSKDVCCQKTGRLEGGWQLFFSHPGFKVQCSVGELFEDLDVKGQGGYVVVPPSLHHTGRRYKWLNTNTPGPAPDWLLDQLRPQPKREPSIPTVSSCTNPHYLQAALNNEVEKVVGARKGARNNTLNAAAFSLGQLEEKGLLRADAEAKLVAAAVEVGLPECASRKTFNSGWDAGRQQPREIPEPERTSTSVATKHTTPETHEWGEPFLLSGTGRLPSFPLDALPGVVGDFVREVAESRQVPVDMPAVAALGVLALCGAGQYRVVFVGHSEPLNLYIVCAMDPGSRKSQTLEDLTRPVHEAEARLVDEASQAVAEDRAAREVAEERAKHLRGRAAKCDDAVERQELQRQVAELSTAMGEEKMLPRLLVDDVTPERLAQLLAENGGRLALFSAEGGVVGMMAGRYQERGGPNLDVYTKGHSGDVLMVDRSSDRRTTRHVPRPALTLCLLVQPEMLHQLAAVKGGRGRGLLGRFLYALPEQNLGRRLYQERAVDPVVRDRYHKLVTELLTVSLAAEPRPLRLAPDALEVWRVFYNAIEIRQSETGDLRPLSDWASKAAGSTARIAGGLHLAKHAGRRPDQVPIDAATMSGAVAIGEYFVSHAMATYGVMGDSPTMQLARRIMRYIERHTVDTFSVRELHQVVRTESPKDLQPALNMLVDRDIVQPLAAEAKTGPGRKPSPRYAVNPKLRKHAQNAHNTVQESENVDSVHCVNDSQGLKTAVDHLLPATVDKDGCLSWTA